MKTILIPTDFSETAKNAVRYGAAFASSIHAQKIILYNAYAMPFSTEMTWALIESEELKKSSEKALNETEELIRPLCGDSIIIEKYADFGFVGQRINDVAAEVHADLIVMGITGGGKFEQAFFGSNALAAVHNTKLPLLIIPPDATWKAVDKIAWACDFHNVKQTTPLHIIEHILGLTKASLHVVHNDPSYKNFDPEIIQENLHIHEFFEGKAYEFALLQDKNLSNAINQYVADKGINWLIVVPQKHGWLSSIFTKSHTSELAFHTHIPMLCLQQ